jgi:hypothetical protein
MTNALGPVGTKAPGNIQIVRCVRIARLVRDYRVEVRILFGALGEGPRMDGGPRWDRDSVEPNPECCGHLGPERPMCGAP